MPDNCTSQGAVCATVNSYVCWIKVMGVDGKIRGNVGHRQEWIALLQRQMKVMGGTEGKERNKRFKKLDERQKRPPRLHPWRIELSSAGVMILLHLRPPHFGHCQSSLWWIVSHEHTMEVCASPFPSSSPSFSNFSTLLLPKFSSVWP